MSASEHIHIGTHSACTHLQEELCGLQLMECGLMSTKGSLQLRTQVLIPLVCRVLLTLQAIVLHLCVCACAGHPMYLLLC